MKNKKNIKYISLLAFALVLSSCNLDPIDTTNTSQTDNPTEEPIQYVATIGSNTHWFVNDVDTGVVVSVYISPNELSAYREYLERYPAFTLNEEEWIIALFSGTLSNRHEVTISFNAKGGSEVSESTLLYGSKIDLPSTNKEDYYLEGWYELNKKWAFETYLATNNTTLVANWIYQRTSKNIGLPIFNIDLKDKDIDQVNREYYIDTLISITNTGKYDELLNLKAEFRGRGHGSWDNYKKRGYRIKFDKKQSLFGEAKSKHWVLVANGHDDSMIRHNLAYTITKETLSNIEYQTSVNVVEVYINNEYRGVYSLFEHVRVDEDRVNIESEFGVNDTGYLIEYNAYAEENNARVGIEYFKVSGMRHYFTMKSPDPDDYLDEGISEQQYRSQVTFIKNYMQELVNSVLNKDFTRFSELADVNSFVDMYLIHELFKNTDTGWSSFYLYKKPGGKVYCGPAWDFDLSSGISRGDSSYTGFYVSDTVRNNTDVYTANELFISLMTQASFVSLFKKRFLELKWQILNSINNYNAVIQYYDEAYIRDANKWTNNDPKYKREQTKVITWLINRTEWLASWAK